MSKAEVTVARANWFYMDITPCVKKWRRIHSHSCQVTLLLSDISADLQKEYYYVVVFFFFASARKKVESDYKSLQERLSTLPDKLSYDIMVNKKHDSFVSFFALGSTFKLI